MKIIIADSSTLIALLDTDNFHLLFELFETIIISDEVYNEITQKFSHQGKIDPLIFTRRLQRVFVEHDDRYEMLRKRLDKGESESISLAKKRDLPLIIDERKGRKIAQSLGIDIIGFVGIVLKLMDKGIISKQRAVQIVEQIEANDFRLSDGLKALIHDY